MKHFYLFTLLLFVAYTSFGQTRVSFDYDNSGNQTHRWICVSCGARIANDTIIKTIETLTESDMIKDEQNTQISYYPNPVVEELYVKWINDDGNFVSSIELYSMAGQRMKSYDHLERTDTAVISFQNYPQGFYNLILVYAKGEKKMLKIVKK
jgi:hypothetical protein